jgi:hypothetical protein
MTKPLESQPKKIYTPPQLTVHGTVMELTKRVGTHGSGDGGTRIGQTKTHV